MEKDNSKDRVWTAQKQIALLNRNTKLRHLSVSFSLARLRLSTCVLLSLETEWRDCEFSNIAGVDEQEKNEKKKKDATFFFQTLNIARSLIVTALYIL